MEAITSSQTIQNLQTLFGFSRFRPGQETTVHQLLNGDSSLAIFPTGSGKSLCYQYTATQLPHLTLVVSPLLALMKDQLDFLASKNIAAASIDSTLTPEQNKQVMADIKAGKLRILMVSVERFKNERFRQFIENIPISMLVVDEAHCISEWGHNFRPDYLKLPAYRQQLNIPLVLLLTATATRKVKQDMAAKFDIAPEHIVQTGFYRPNLNLQMMPVAETEKSQKLIQLLAQHTGAGIIYVTLQQSAEQLAYQLKAQGFNAVAYHAGLRDEQRQEIQQHFMSGKTDIVVATIAFGMGIDKANIRFVIHYDLPKSIENYSQEIGRAGRDGQPADCIILANLSSLNTLENFIYGDTPEPGSIHRLIDAIKAAENGHWELQLYSLSQDCNIRQLPLKTLLVQLELRQVIRAKYSYFAEYKLRLLADAQSVVARFTAERQRFVQAIFDATAFKKTWGILDIEQLQQAYSCDRSRVLTALDYLQQQGLIELQSSKMTEVYQVNSEAVSQPDLAEQLTHYFQQNEQSEISRIAALIRFMELDTCLSYNLARYFDDQQAPKHCGHCSVCQGQVAHLPKSQPLPFPDDATLQHNLVGLKKHLTLPHISETLAARFLCGLTQPLFTRGKARQLPGWGSCELQRFEEVRQKAANLPPLG
ncbi:RecQ family ATP-dependent DNA helicase [Planctobacterium marinum]|uniref:RecQ family ATP-dependent DNA helicase n=1 Tax=Planctobacterium marinum TaxID=1631968 RepID=UPI001E3E61CF|nr:RecQ family ATP-dependent DNA helicase [Planctobacterium marinum]MCC2608072.1 RecQ family ATP-dependent DNA helicase [Planctobacterium marinum]